MYASCCLECLVRFDGGDDGLLGDAAVGDQLAAGTARGRREGCGPQVLVDDDAGRAARVHRRGEVRDVLLGQELSELCLELAQLTEVSEILQLPGSFRMPVETRPMPRMVSTTASMILATRPIRLTLRR